MFCIDCGSRDKPSFTYRVPQDRRDIVGKDTADLDVADDGEVQQLAYWLAITLGDSELAKRLEEEYVQRVVACNLEWPDGVDQESYMPAILDSIERTGIEPLLLWSASELCTTCDGTGDNLSDEGDEPWCPDCDGDGSTGCIAWTTNYDGAAARRD